MTHIEAKPGTLLLALGVLTSTTAEVHISMYQALMADPELEMITFEADTALIMEQHHQFLAYAALHAITKNPDGITPHLLHDSLVAVAYERYKRLPREEAPELVADLLAGSTLAKQHVLETAYELFDLLSKTVELLPGLCSVVDTLGQGAIGQTFALNNLPLHSWGILRILHDRNPGLRKILLVELAKSARTAMHTFMNAIRSIKMLDPEVETRIMDGASDRVTRDLHQKLIA